DREQSDGSEEEDDSDAKSGGEVQGGENVERGEDRAMLKDIGVAAEELTPIYIKCENCEEEFDVRSNERGDCVWHPGDKELADDSSFWDDHDWQCHGDPNDFVDDAAYDEGFIYSCCEKSGGAEGCKVTRHK
ncbi:hypothetical protein BJ875DRAFT_362651, partial [Amylocarpus encephaloides]